MLTTLTLATKHVHSQEWNLNLEKHSSAAGIQLQGAGTSRIPLLKLNVRPFHKVQVVLHLALKGLGHLPG